MSGRLSQAITGLLGGIFYLFLAVATIWVEVGGMYHAFTGHGGGTGVAAVLIAPVAWWHSVEFFWHSDESSTSSSVPDIPDGQVIETLFENAWWSESEEDTNYVLS